MAEITTSLDWAQVSIQLESAAKKMKRYGPEMLKMSSAIGHMVKKLSEEEIKTVLLPAHDVWLSAEEALALNICDSISIVER